MALSGGAGTKKVLVKIIIIGESGVGKTALLHKYISGKFVQDHKSTIGADFHTKDLVIENKTITLQIWDTAGQERFQSLGNAFYRGADACILVYDITDEKTFEQIADWKQKFESQTSIEKPRDYPFLLLGNKSDLGAQRRVEEQTGQGYAQKHNMFFFETSAQNGSNITKAMERIATNAAEKPTVPFFHEEVVQAAFKQTMESEVNGGNQEAGGCGCQLL